jgi:hypothetical protein
MSTATEAEKESNAGAQVLDGRPASLRVDVGVIELHLDRGTPSTT